MYTIPTPLYSSSGIVHMYCSLIVLIERYDQTLIFTGVEFSVVSTSNIFLASTDYIYMQVIKYKPY